MRQALILAAAIARGLLGEFDTIGFLLGAAVLVRGVAMVSVAAAYIVAGAALCGVSYVASRRRP